MNDSQFQNHIEAINQKYRRAVQRADLERQHDLEELARIRSLQQWLSPMVMKDCAHHRGEYWDAIFTDNATICRQDSEVDIEIDSVSLSLVFPPVERGAIKRAVYDAARAFSGPFKSTDIEKLIRHSSPRLAQSPIASISSALARLVAEGVVKILQPGGGQRPAVFELCEVKRG